MKKRLTVLLCVLLITQLTCAMATEALPEGDIGAATESIPDAVDEIADLSDANAEAPVADMPDANAQLPIEDVPDEDVEIPVDAVEPPVAEEGFLEDLPVETEATAEARELSIDSEAMGAQMFDANQASDFEIVNGVLTKYTGAGGDVVVPDGVTAIGDKAFRMCTTVTSVTLPEGLKSIGKRAFYWCRTMQSINIPSSVITIDSFAFHSCFQLLKVDIPAGVSNIGEYAFYACVNLRSIDIPGALTSIAPYAFGGLVNVAEIVIPANITAISDNAFDSCSRLTDVTINSSNISIGNAAFSNCPSTVVFHTICDTPATKWAEGMGYSVAKSDHTLETIPGRAPDYYMSGLTEGKRCTVCGATVVAQEQIPIVPFPEIHLTKSATRSVNVGDCYVIVVDGKTIKSFKNSKKSVAYIASSGLLYAKKAGKTKITINLAGKKKKKLVLTLKVVDPTAPSKVYLAEGRRVTLKVGQTLQLNPGLTPDTAQTTYKWKSSKKGVASVDGGGVITAKKKGTAKITVTTANKKKATIKVKVVK